MLSARRPAPPHCSPGPRGRISRRRAEDADALSAVGLLATARIDEALDARVRTGWIGFTDRESATVATGAVVGERAAVRIGLAGAGGRRLADLLGTGPIGRGADTAARVAADRARRTDGGPAALAVQAAAAVADRRADRARVAARRRVAGAVLRGAYLTDRAILARGTRSRIGTAFADAVAP